MRHADPAEHDDGRLSPPDAHFAATAIEEYGARVNDRGRAARIALWIRRAVRAYTVIGIHGGVDAPFHGAFEAEDPAEARRLALQENPGLSVACVLDGRTVPARDPEPTLLTVAQVARRAAYARSVAGRTHALSRPRSLDPEIEAARDRYLERGFTVFAGESVPNAEYVGRIGDARGRSLYVEVGDKAVLEFRLSSIDGEPPDGSNAGSKVRVSVSRARVSFEAVP